jgi:hypothetical protein
MVTNGAATMSGPQLAALDALVVALKAASLFTTSKIAKLYLGALHDQIAAKIDLIGATSIMTQGTGGGGSVPWVAYAGWNPASVTNRGLNCQVNPSTATSQNSAGSFVYLGSNSADTTNDVQGDPLTGFGLSVRASSVNCRTHSANQSFMSLGTLVPGFYGVMRTASTTTKLYGPNGAQLGSTNAVVSVAPTSTGWYLGGAAFSGSTADRTVKAHGLTTGLSDAEVLALCNALTTFMTDFHA